MTEPCALVLRSPNGQLRRIGTFSRYGPDLIFHSWANRGWRHPMGGWLVPPGIARAMKEGDVRQLYLYDPRTTITWHCYLSDLLRHGIEQRHRNHIVALLLDDVWWVPLTGVIEHVQPLVTAAEIVVDTPPSTENEGKKT